MKRGYLLTALLFTAFMFPFFGNISNADALGNYRCGKKQGNITKKQHVNCLRGLLTSTPHGLTVPKGKNGLGKFGCGNKNRKKHVNCLRRLLDQHGPHYAKGGAGHTNATGMPPMGMNPPMPPMGMPPMGMNPPMPPTGAQPVLPPTGGMPTAAMPPADPCMAVTDPNDIVTCRASHPAPGMGMPPMGMNPPMPPMGMPPMGMNPPMPPMGMPPMGMNPPMPPTGAQPVLPPTGGMPTAAMPPADPCMAVTDANDKAACVASHPAPGMGMPPTGMYPPTMGTPPMGMPPMGAQGNMAPGTAPMGDPCMVVPAGPDRDACYATTPPR